MVHFGHRSKVFTDGVSNVLQSFFFSIPFRPTTRKPRHRDAYTFLSTVKDNRVFHTRLAAHKVYTKVGFCA